MTENGQLNDRVKAEAEREGFIRCGIAEARALEEESAHLDAWLAEDYHGQMTWMATTAPVRKDPRHPGMLLEARSVIVMAAPYPRHQPYQGPPPGRVAKYALGRDYHNVLAKRARLEAGLRARLGRAGRRGLRRKELLPDRPRDRVACIPCVRDHDGAAPRGRPDSPPLRKLHFVPRRLPDASLRRAAQPRCPQVHILFDY